jgi:hypothetical protein
MADFKYNGAHNFTFTVSDGLITNSKGIILDISGIGQDLSGTAILKIAPIDNKDSFYSLLSAKGHTIQNVDCSGYNIIRTANGTIKGVGYIDNPTAVNAFVSDTSGNLWVGGNNMTVKDNYYGSSVSNAESMFIVPYITSTQPTGFSHVDVSGCYDICPVRNLMMATVLDVSGICHNWAASGASRTVDNTVFPRIGDNTAAFNMYTAPSAGGVVINETAMDLSGHRLVAFARSGTTGYDVSGFYVVRQNTTNANGSTASSVTGLSGSSSGNGIKFDISLNKIAFEASRNKLYVGTNVNNANSVPLIVPLDTSANVVVGNYDISHNALFAYAAPTSSIAAAADGSGFMFVCTNPSAAGARPIIRLDASGTHFDTLTLLDVSGVNAMASVVAPNGGNNYNHLFLVDASRNTVDVNTYNNMAKLALIKLSSRSDNTNNYYDGSGVQFTISNSGANVPLSYVNIRDIRVDANGNVFIAGHYIYTITDTTTVNEIAQAIETIGIAGAANLAALISGAYTTDIDLLEAVDPNLSVTELSKKIYKLPSTVN